MASNAGTGTLYLKNLRQKGIYECELLGQLSDGIWENDNFNWSFWHGLDVEVSDDKFGWYSNEIIPDRTGFELYKLNDYDLTDRVKKFAILYEMGYNKEEAETLESQDYQLKYGFDKYTEKCIEHCPSLKDKMPDTGEIEVRISQYDEEMLYEDLESIMRAMETSIRKIGFLD
jgi:hypothetical protein